MFGGSALDLLKGGIIIFVIIIIFAVLGKVIGIL